MIRDPKSTQVYFKLLPKQFKILELTKKGLNGIHAHTHLTDTPA